jgi:hypothetical protein
VAVTEIDAFPITGAAGFVPSLHARVFLILGGLDTRVRSELRQMRGMSRR